MESRDLQAVTRHAIIRINMPGNFMQQVSVAKKSGKTNLLKTNYKKNADMA